MELVNSFEAAKTRLRIPASLSAVRPHGLGSTPGGVAPHTFTHASPAPSLIVRPHRRGNGPHDSDVSSAPRVDPERLDGLPTRAAGERPRGVRPLAEQVATALSAASYCAHLDPSILA